MTCIIAIETATEACSAALLIKKAGKLSLYHRFLLAPREHTKLILPMLEEVLQEAELQLSDVNAIAFGRGPGAFTGLRIATGIAQGLSLSVDKPTVPVSSLKAMALAAIKESEPSNSGSIVVAIDARMGEVYWAEYKSNHGQLALVGEEQLSNPETMFVQTQALTETHAVTVIGSGWDTYIDSAAEIITNRDRINHIPQKFPDAVEISALAMESFEAGESYSLEDAQPVYLRNNVAEKSRKTKD